MIPYWIGSLLTVRIRKRDVGNRAVAGWDGKQENGADAEWSLGGAYGAGEGVPRDDKSALYWLKKAAEEGLCPCGQESKIHVGFDSVSVDAWSGISV
jgi:hypothetical protein